MIGGVKLKVTYSNEHTCFAYVSLMYTRSNEQNHCIEASFKEKKILLWAVYGGGIPEGQISCNPTFCSLVGLQEGDEVFVTPLNNIRVLEKLEVIADGPDDQEILEDNALILRYRILDQLRLVAAHQKACVWISPSMPIVFTPKETGILVNHSTIYVKFNVFKNISEDQTNMFKKDEKVFKNIGCVNNEILAPYINIPQKIVTRALPIDSDGKKNLIHPYTVFLHEDLLDKRYKELTVILAIMKNIPALLMDENNDDADDDDESSKIQAKNLCVEIVPIDNVVFRSLSREIYNRNIPTVLIPKSLNAIINSENGRKIMLTIIGDTVDHPDHIDIITYSECKQSETEVIDRFKKCVIDNTHSGKKFLINDEMIKQNTQITDGFLQFRLKPESLKYTMLNSESFRSCTVAAKCLRDADVSIPKRVQPDFEYELKSYCRTMKSMQSLIEDIVSHLYFEIHREASFKGASEIKSNVLLTGVSGSGKTALCHIVQKELTVWSHLIHCRSLRGRKDLPEVLSKSILMCQEHSPAVLICDDIDALVHPNMEGFAAQDIANENRLAKVIKRLLQKCKGVCVLMTSLSLKDLHPILRQFSGKPMYTAHFDIPELDQNDRMQLFKHLVNDKIRDEFQVEEEDFVKVVMETSGYTVRDVTDYFNKKIFNAVKRKRADPEFAKPRLIENINMEKEKANEFDIWDTIGGMDDVKQELTECIFWPIMYPALFPSQSCGILLYGPPGTGKSHIGSCLARLTNMNFIAVKGPELLSKYIGQSEKAVRDIFDKADARRPCILFFDEFDSLAPKRGHDSTGVTDRVVNQLLTRMDGVEGGAKGPVIVATSRPDLIDPALLRPGRIERHIYCALPNEQDRCEVLKTLSKSMSLHEDVNLQELAARTEGFSPADLKSLLVTAQLTRLEKQLDENDESNMETIVVYEEDVESALNETKPSLSKEQRLFFDMIYKRFRREPLLPEQETMSTQLMKQKVTLA